MMFIQRSAIVSTICISRALGSAGFNDKVIVGVNEPDDATSVGSNSDTDTWDLSETRDKPVHAQIVAPSVRCLSHTEPLKDGSSKVPVRPRPSWASFTTTHGSSFGKSTAGTEKDVKNAFKNRRNKRLFKDAERANHKSVQDFKRGTIVYHDGHELYGIIESLKPLKIVGVERMLNQDGAQEAFAVVRSLDDFAICEFNVYINDIVKALTPQHLELYESSEDCSYEVAKFLCTIFTTANSDLTEREVPAEVAALGKSIDYFKSKDPRAFLKRIRVTLLKKPDKDDTFAYNAHTVLKKSLDALFTSLKPEQLENAMQNANFNPDKCCSVL